MTYSSRTSSGVKGQSITEMLCLKTSRILIYFMVMALSHTSDLLCNFRRRSQSLYHPPYSPDLAPCDFFLFPKHNFFYQVVVVSPGKSSNRPLVRVSEVFLNQRTLTTRRKLCRDVLLDKWFFRCFTMHITPQIKQLLYSTFQINESKIQRS